MHKNLLLPENTLGHQLARPLFTRVGFGDMPTATFAQGMKKVLNGSTHLTELKSKRYPQNCAAEFYGMNHAVAMIKQRRSIFEPLPQYEFEIVKDYVDTWCVESIRAFFYLMVIITREFRHASGKGALKTQYGDWAYNFASSLNGQTTYLCDNAPDVPLHKYTEMVTWQFANLSYSGGYGGKPWSNVSMCAHNFVTGVFSTEIMLDTIWTLAHNGGPIFNKGFLFHTQNNTTLLKVLDAQRGGQIPQLVNQGDAPHDDPKLLDRMKWLIHEFKLPESVDWDEIKKLGGIGNFDKGSLIGYKPASPKPKYHGTTSKKHTPFSPDKGSLFYVMPNLSVTKFKIQRAGAK